jgi:hypothetical protein
MAGFYLKMNDPRIAAQKFKIKQLNDSGALGWFFSVLRELADSLIPLSLI